MKHLNMYECLNFTVIIVGNKKLLAEKFFWTNNLAYPSFTMVTCYQQYSEVKDINLNLFYLK